ncbi:hypothetical protein BJ165DRAFT_224030 [Panaeolus papilionaceus]|nr:hypothetical protein BJ165DRAFT_224030 [Panaeolus papilionaceus]
MKYPTPLIALIVIFPPFVFAAPLPSETEPLRHSSHFNSTERRTPASNVCRAFCRTLAKELKVHAASFAIDSGKPYLDHARVKNPAPTDANLVSPMSGRLQGTVQSPSKANSDAGKRLALHMSQQVMADSREKQASLAKKVVAFNKVKTE